MIAIAHRVERLVAQDAVERYSASDGRFEADAENDAGDQFGFADGAARRVLPYERGECERL